MRTLVIGLGNRLRGDDGVGPLVAERLRRALPGATVLEREGAPPDLFELWTPDARVVLVDAARGGGAPGTVHRLDARQASLPCDLLRVSTHAGGVAAAVELARALGCLPAALVVYAIEGASFETGTGPSEPVLRAVDEVVLRLLEELGGAPCTRPA